jgi:5-methylcytosine-specific restriction endonuclease McrA
MTLPAELVNRVRQRAQFACEYCGVTEVDSAGQLTVDHYRPRSRGGTDTLENLLYCCYRCNLYKADYWPEAPDDPVLWVPARGRGKATCSPSRTADFTPSPRWGNSRCNACG